MERILVFCSRDWLHPDAGRVERYAHAVFSRIAAQGHYVVWVAHSLRGQRARGNSLSTAANQLEDTDGIHVARLGARALYRMMSSLFLARLTKNDSGLPPFSAVVDCVTGRPLPLPERSTTPIIPLVFDLNPRVQLAERPGGPILAVSDEARQRLLRAGVPGRYIVRAPYGVGCQDPTAHGGKALIPTLVVADRMSRTLVTALCALRKKGIVLEVDVFGRSRFGQAPAWRRLPMLRFHADGDPAARHRIYQRAWIGYCGAGREHEAIEMAASGLPVICPATNAGREYVTDGQTGLLFEAGQGRSLAACCQHLLEDGALRDQFAQQARVHAQSQSWDRTAGLVLATIENLPKPAATAPARSSRILVPR